MLSIRYGFIIIAVTAFAIVGTAVAAPPLKGPQSGRPAAPGSNFDRSFEMDGAYEVQRLCAEKTIKTLALTVVPVSALSFAEISVHTEAGHYTVLLPLKNPQGSMKSLYWGADTIEEALTFMRLLEGGKIKALKVEAYAEEFNQTSDRTATKTDFQECRAEALKDLLKPCADCYIVEWVFGSLIE